MSARLSALEQQCAQQRQQQQDALTAVSTCLATAISSNRDRLTAASSVAALDSGSGVSSSAAQSAAGSAPLRPSSSRAWLSSPALRNSSSRPSLSHTAEGSNASDASNARLSDLCAADKAKVGKLLLALAQVKAKQLHNSHSGSEHERSVWQREKKQLDQQLARSMALVTHFQQRLRRAEQRSGRESDTPARAQQTEQAALTRPQRSAGVSDAAVQRSERRADNELDTTSMDELHRLVAAQRAAITQRMDSIMHQTSVDLPHSTTQSRFTSLPTTLDTAHLLPASQPQSHSPADSTIQPSHAPSIHRREKVKESSRGADAQSDRETLSSLSPSPPTFPVPQSAYRSPLTVSIQYGGSRHRPEATAHARSVGATSASVPPLAPPTSHRSSASDFRSAPALSARSRSLKTGRAAADDPTKDAAASEADSSSEEEGAVARSMSPVSRRIQRLITIQRGRSSSNSETAARSSSTQSSTQRQSQPKSQTRLPSPYRPLAPPTARPARSPCLDDDVELDELLHALNHDNHNTRVSAARSSCNKDQQLGNDRSSSRAAIGLPSPNAATTSVSGRNRLSHLSRFDNTLIDVISAVDTWR